MEHIFQHPLNSGRVLHNGSRYDHKVDIQTFSFSLCRATTFITKLFDFTYIWILSSIRNKSKQVCMKHGLTSTRMQLQKQLEFWSCQEMQKLSICVNFWVSYYELGVEITYGELGVFLSSSSNITCPNSPMLGQNRWPTYNVRSKLGDTILEYPILQQFLLHCCIS